MSRFLTLRSFVRVALLGLTTQSACTVTTSAPSSQPLTVQTPPAEAEAPSASNEPVSLSSFASATQQPSSEQIPVEPVDAVWGNPQAPVTLVEFSDLQCPFCQRVGSTLEALKQRYAGKLRIVWKHNPLPFHQEAKPAAHFAQAVLLTAGPEAFFRFVTLVFQDQQHMGADALARHAVALGLDSARVAELARSPAVLQKVERDMDLAQRTGATGTPNFFANGIKISGAQPIEKFVEAIDAELGAIAELGSRTPPDQFYAVRVAKNYAAPAPAALPGDTKPEAPDTTVWKLPVTGAPSEGPADALVTIVAFYDYQCPFSKRAQDTIKQLREKYPKDVRIVVRHNPLSFHPQAKAAATLAVEARAQRGDAGFFEASRRIFESAPSVGEDDLLKIAADMKLNEGRVKRALKNDVHKKLLENDTDLAASYEARSTPHFFINGVRLSGAQPLEKFVEAVERERTRGQSIVDAGLPRARVYAEIMKTASEPAPPERKEVPAPTASNPARGPAKGPFVIQVFSDFQCPFCSRVLPTLKELDQRYPGKIRWVWYNLPLPFHPQAKAAARAALEARAQQGDTGFWKMHDLIYEGQKDLSDDALIAIARRLGLDVERFKAALTDGRHDAAIDADLAVATKAQISGTPGFVINGYFLSGSQPAAAFAKLINYAAKHPAKPVKAAAQAQAPSP
jgi:protein-disulfide isomerase